MYFYVFTFLRFSMDVPVIIQIYRVIGFPRCGYPSIKVFANRRDADEQKRKWEDEAHKPDCPKFGRIDIEEYHGLWDKLTGKVFELRELRLEKPEYDEEKK